MDEIQEEDSCSIYPVSISNFSTELWKDTLFSFEPGLYSLVYVLIYNNSFIMEVYEKTFQTAEFVACVY